MEFEQLADEVETWMSRFYSNLNDDFTMISNPLWEVIWMCIHGLQQRYPQKQYFHNCIRRYDREIEFQNHNYERVLKDEYNADQIKQWILEFITTIPKTEYFYLELLLADEPMDTITIHVCSIFKHIQNYIYFMQCLFPDANKFQFTDIIRSTVDKRRRFQQFHQRNRPIPQPRFYCNWKLEKATYQRCLKLFPRWPIVINDPDDLLLDCVSTWMIPDLAQICINYLPTWEDYPHIHELPQKH